MNLFNVLLLASILVVCVIMYNVLKNQMNIHYSMIWIVWGVGMIVISAFPNIVRKISNILGIEVSSNTVFLIFIFFSYCLTYYLYLKISRHNEDILNLNYEIASLKKRLEYIESKK